MKTIYLICDESEAKGYSDKQEKYPGEVGVIAGFVFPEKHLNEIRSDLEKITSSFFMEGKRHITDMSPDDQERIRNDLFPYLKKRNILCLYEAIHSEGLHRFHKTMNNLNNKAKEQRRSEIKLSNNQTKELLQEQLFQGLFGKAVELCTDYEGKTFRLKVITDTIDAYIKKCFEKSAKEFLSVGNNVKVKNVTGYDPVKKDVRKGKITSKVEDPNNLMGDFSGVQFTIEIQDSCLTFAADVIANSISHHFKNREDDTIGSALNTIDAIRGHPLESIIYGLWKDDTLNYFADALFMHPKGKGVSLPPRGSLFWILFFSSL